MFSLRPYRWSGKINVSSASQAYLSYLNQQIDAAIVDSEQALGRGWKFTRYDVVLNGFAAKMSARKPPCCARSLACVGLSRPGLATGYRYKPRIPWI